MLKNPLAAKPECDTYLDHIISENADQDGNITPIQLLAESIEYPLLRDTYFSRDANPKERLAWVKVPELTKTPYATANALCLAAFHTTDTKSKGLYISAALREDPNHKLANLMEEALEYGIIDRVNKTMARSGAKAYQHYINACAKVA